MATLTRGRTVRSHDALDDLLEALEELQASVQQAVAAAIGDSVAPPSGVIGQQRPKRFHIPSFEGGQ